MSSYLLPVFGNIDITSLEAFYDAEMEWKGHTIQLDLNFEETSVEALSLAFVRQFLDNLSTYDAQNKAWIEEDFECEGGDTVSLYIDLFTEGMDEEEMSTFVDTTIGVSPQKQMLSKLYLVRVGFYIDADEPCAVFDYSLDENLTNHLIVMIVSPTGELLDITIES